MSKFLRYILYEVVEILCILAFGAVCFVLGVGVGVKGAREEAQAVQKESR